MEEIRVGPAAIDPRGAAGHRRVVLEEDRVDDLRRAGGVHVEPAAPRRPVAVDQAVFDQDRAAARMNAAALPGDVVRGPVVHDPVRGHEVAGRDRPAGLHDQVGPVHLDAAALVGADIMHDPAVGQVRPGPSQQGQAAAPVAGQRANRRVRGRNPGIGQADAGARQADRRIRPGGADAAAVIADAVIVEIGLEARAQRNAGQHAAALHERAAAHDVRAVAADVDPPAAPERGVIHRHSTPIPPRPVHGHEEIAHRQDLDVGLARRGDRPAGALGEVVVEIGVLRHEPADGGIAGVEAAPFALAGVLLKLPVGQLHLARHDAEPAPVAHGKIAADGGLAHVHHARGLEEQAAAVAAGEVVRDEAAGLEITLRALQQRDPAAVVAQVAGDGHVVEQPRAAGHRQAAAEGRRVRGADVADELRVAGQQAAVHEPDPGPANARVVPDLAFQRHRAHVREETAATQGKVGVRGLRVPYHGCGAQDHR